MWWGVRFYLWEKKHSFLLLLLQLRQSMLQLLQLCSQRTLARVSRVQLGRKRLAALAVRAAVHAHVLVAGMPFIKLTKTARCSSSPQKQPLLQHLASSFSAVMPCCAACSSASTCPALRQQLALCSVQTLAADTHAHLIYAPLMHRALGALVLYLAQSIAARV